MAWAHTTGKVHIKSDGITLASLSAHIRDIIAAILSVLEAPRDAIHNETFNVGQTRENYRISQLAEIVADTVSWAVASSMPLVAAPTSVATALTATRSSASCRTSIRSGTPIKEAQELYGSLSEDWVDL